MTDIQTISDAHLEALVENTERDGKKRRAAEKRAIDGHRSNVIADVEAIGNEVVALRRMQDLPDLTAVEARFLGKYAVRVLMGANLMQAKEVQVRISEGAVTEAQLLTHMRAIREQRNRNLNVTESWIANAVEGTARAMILGHPTPLALLEVLADV